MIRGVILTILVITIAYVAGALEAREQTIGNSTSSSFSSSERDWKLWHQLFDDLDRTTTAAYVAAAFSVLTFTLILSIVIILLIKKCVEKRKGVTGRDLYGAF